MSLGQIEIRDKKWFDNTAEKGIAETIYKLIPILKMTSIIPNGKIRMKNQRKHSYT